MSYCSHYYPHFSDLETGREKFSESLNEAQSVSGRYHI